MPNYDLETGVARENLSRLIGACYYQPGPEFAEEKVFESMLDAAMIIHPELAVQARRLGEYFSSEGEETLLLDYTRLFLGPNHIVASPYGSVWLERDKAAMGPSTLAVIELYREGGFDISEEFRELPDHIAAELEFLYLLIFRENEAHRSGHSDALKEKGDLRRRFLDEHLGVWAGPFTAAVKAGAQSRYYRELAGLTDAFVSMETGRDRKH